MHCNEMYFIHCFNSDLESAINVYTCNLALLYGIIIKTTVLESLNAKSIMSYCKSAKVGKSI